MFAWSVRVNRIVKFIFGVFCGQKFLGSSKKLIAFRTQNYLFLIIIIANVSNGKRLIFSLYSVHNTFIEMSRRGIECRKEIPYATEIFFDISVSFFPSVLKLEIVFEK